jgi:hypothetical protein
MGYDMKMVRTPASVPAGYQPQYDGQPEYHRFNIHWMPRMRDMMQRAQVLDDCGEPFELLPWWPPDGLTRERADQLEESPDSATAEEKALLAGYEETRERVLAEVSSEEGKVGYWKFCSNDGWHVTPDECRLIADKLSRNLGPDLWADLDIEAEPAREALARWIDFNRLAAENGGFRVY